MADMNNNNDVFDLESLKTKNTKFILVASLILVIVIALFGGAMLFYNPTQKKERDSVGKVEQATEAIQKENYDEALQILSTVDEEWKDNEEVAGTRAIALEGYFGDNLSEYTDAKDYEGILKAFKLHSVDPSSTKELKTIYKDAKKKYVKQVIKEVEGYEKEKNNKKAILRLNEARDLTNDATTLKNKYKEVKKVYRKNVLKKARTKYKEGYYNEAYQLINDGLEILPDEPKFLEQITLFDNGQIK